MTPLMIALGIALGIGALGSFVYFARVAREDHSVRSMVANENRQARFLFSGLALIVGALLAWWLA